MTEFFTHQPDVAISTETVNEVMDEIQSAVSTTFQNGNYYRMVRSGPNLIPDQNPPQDSRITKYKELEKRVINTITENEFNMHLDSSDLGIVTLTQKDPDGNFSAIIWSNSAQDTAGRFYALAFELKFGANQTPLTILVDQVQRNPLFIKSLMERVFSKNGKAEGTFFNKKLRYNKKTRWDNLSPFTCLINGTNNKVVVKSNTS